jgi:nucleotide-binding universal stress UspA family protein
VDYRRILVPTDFSASARRGVERAAAIARAAQAKVLLLFVVEKAMIAPMGLIHQAPVTFGGEGDLLGEAVEDSEKRLKALRDEWFPGVDAATKVAVAATAAAGILEQAEAFQPDLVVVSVMHLLVGSTTEKVVRHAPCEVLVVR